MVKLTENMRGALFMMTAMAGYTLNDSMIKLVSTDLPLFQAVFLRGIAATLLLGVLAWRSGGLAWRPARGEVHVIFWRTFAEVAATFCFLTALFHMPLANATAILQSLPLAVTLAASVFLGHRVGWRRYLAIAAGFGGVLLIIRPGTEGFNAYSLWALAAVALVTFRDLLSHRLKADTPSTTVALVTAASVMLFGAAGSLTQTWQPVSGGNLVTLGMAALFILTGYIASIAAMRHGEIAVVSPFRYSALLWALGLGFVLFRDIPDLLTGIGSAIVVATGIFTFYRENRAAARLRRAQER